MDGKHHPQTIAAKRDLRQAWSCWDSSSSWLLGDEKEGSWFHGDLTGLKRIFMGFLWDLMGSIGIQWDAMGI